MALTKAEFADCLFEEIGLNKREAKEMIEFFFRRNKKLVRTWSSGKDFWIWKI